VKQYKRLVQLFSIVYTNETTRNVYLFQLIP